MQEARRNGPLVPRSLFLIPICEPKTGNLLIKAPGVPIGNSGVSHARILSYPLRLPPLGVAYRQPTGLPATRLRGRVARPNPAISPQAAAPRRYLRFVRLIWRLGNVYLRFVRLSEHDTLGITALRLLESCGSRSASTLPSTPRNADSPLFSPLSAPIHLSVHDFQWAIGKGSSQTAPRTVFVLYDDNQLGRDIQGRGEDSTLPGFRAPISTIHARRFGNGQYYENTSSLDVQAKWKSCTTPPTSATRGGSTRSPAMRTRPICSAVLPRRTTAARPPSPRCVRRSAMRSSVRSRRPGCRNIRSSSTRLV